MSLVRPDTQLLHTLEVYGTLGAIGEDNVFPTLEGVFDACRADPGIQPRGPA